MRTYNYGDTHLAALEIRERVVKLRINLRNKLSGFLQTFLGLTGKLVPLLKNPEVALLFLLKLALQFLNEHQPATEMALPVGCIKQNRLR